MAPHKPYYQLPIFCASSSPRRRFILQTVFENVQIIKNPFDEPDYEQSLHTSPLQYALLLAESKLNAAVKHHPELLANNDAIWICADTVVQLGNQHFGKPKDAADAKNMLLELSGKTHQVHTAIAMRTQQRQNIFHETTHVSFRKLNDFELEGYLKNANYLDKAGAYAIQEEALCFIEKIEGCLSNVVGLPLPKLIQQLLHQF